MNLHRRIGKLETTYAPPTPPPPVRLTPEQRHDANEILARVWKERHGDQTQQFESAMQVMRDHGMTGKPQRSWFRLADE